LRFTPVAEFVAAFCFSQNNQGELTMQLNIEERRELLKRGFSRRSFGRFATVITAGAALPFYNESAMAQLSMIKGPMPADAVKINANENPLGPCPEAADAMYGVIQKGAPRTPRRRIGIFVRYRRDDANFAT